MARKRTKKKQNAKHRIESGYTSVSSQIAPKSTSQTRKDIGSWRRAMDMARNVSGRQLYPLHLLYEDIETDALLTSQKNNRMLKVLSLPFMLKDVNGDTNETETKSFQNEKWVNEISTRILESIWYGHSLVELLIEDGNLITKLIPRTNVNQFEGLVYLDYSNPDKSIKYRESDEYGYTLLEFGKEGDLGLLNKTVPHVLMKRFATSCWSELGEIYGIPPRVLKTNTHNPAMLNRSEKMMRDMGAAAWFIIDESEDFEFAKGVSTNGDVYNNLIGLCNSEISLLSSGALIGQDTQNGSRSKDESAQDMLQQLINYDLSLLEQYWNTSVIPALVELGILKEGLTFAFEVTEDISDLWAMTQAALPYYEMDIEWLNNKFGLKITEKKASGFDQMLNLNLNPNDFF